MANDITTNPRLWILDTAGAIKAVGNCVRISHAFFIPNAAGDDVEVAEYGPNGTTTQKVFAMKAVAGAADPVDRDFVPPIELNGVNLATIDGGVLRLEIASVD